MLSTARCAFVTFLKRAGRAMLRTAVDERLDSVIEQRREEDAEQSDTQHAAEDGHSQRAAHFSPSSAGNDQWHYTENERERRHQDRPEPEMHGLESSASCGNTGFALLFSEFDNEDCILAREAD